MNKERVLIFKKNKWIILKLKYFQFRDVIFLACKLTKYGGVIVDKSKSFYYIKIFSKGIDRSIIMAFITYISNNNKILKKYTTVEPIDLIRDKRNETD